MDTAFFLHPGDFHLPYVCPLRLCRSPRAVAIPFFGPPLAEEGRVLSSLPPDLQQLYGPRGRYILFQFRCVDCSATWMAFFIFHTGGLDNRSPQQLYRFALGDRDRGHHSHNRNPFSWAANFTNNSTPNLPSQPESTIAMPTFPYRPTVSDHDFELSPHHSGSASAGAAEDESFFVRQIVPSDQPTEQPRPYSTTPSPFAQ